MTPVQKRFVYWITERESIRLKKESGAPRPWTKDPILHAKKFCNVNREHDTVTRWIARHVRPLLNGASLSEALFQLYICRVFNDPDVLETIMPVQTVDDMVSVLQRRKANGLKILRGAYLVVPHGTSMPVEEFYAAIAFKVRKLKFPHGVPDTLARVAEELMSLSGIHDFMANQVCTDLRYTPSHDAWDDWGSFVLAGPGTRRGLARYFAELGQTPRRASNGRVSGLSGSLGPTLLEIRERVCPLLPPATADHFRDPNNLANSFCEFDKYERALEGTASLRMYVPEPSIM
jgi:hypothetical protein